MIRCDPAKNGRVWTSILMIAWSFLAFCAMFPEVIGRFEGRTVPVVRDFELTSISENDQGYTVVTAIGNKVRSCGFRSIEWRLDGRDGTDTLLTVDNAEIQKVKLVGPVSYGPWLIRASKDDLMTRGAAMMYHLCHPLFLTRTPVFRAPGIR